MNEFVLYNLKAGACLAGFYLFYKLLLSRETLPGSTASCCCCLRCCRSCCLCAW